MMTKRVFNFYPGPATLPREVLEEAQEELLNFKGSGMSVLEISHRSKDFEGLILETEAMFKETQGIGDDYRVLFLQGGASLQFTMVPMNFLPAGETADYCVTGGFAEKAYKEAKLLGNIHVAASTKDEGHKHIPRQEELSFSTAPAYLHITSNNTIFGTQWQDFPATKGVPLVADMSSDILSRPFDVSPFGLIYAGAQKNLGPSGLTVVVIRQDLLERVPKGLPSLLSYTTYADNNSLYNTPPSFPIYILNKIVKWVEAQGGLSVIEQKNREKAGLIYDVLDSHPAFYKGHARGDSRSQMNITFRLPSEELEKHFIKEAQDASMVGLKGHRSAGGIRASIYNAMPQEGCKSLADFMLEFLNRHA